MRERERERERKRIEGFVCVSQSRVPPRTTMVLVLWYLVLELYFYVLFRMFSEEFDECCSLSIFDICIGGKVCENIFKYL